MKEMKKNPSLKKSEQQIRKLEVIIIASFVNAM